MVPGIASGEILSCASDFGTGAGVSAWLLRRLWIRREEYGRMNKIEIRATYSFLKFFKVCIKHIEIFCVQCRLAEAQNDSVYSSNEEEYEKSDLLNRVNFCKLDPLFLHRLITDQSLSDRFLLGANLFQ